MPRYAGPESAGRSRWTARRSGSGPAPGGQAVEERAGVLDQPETDLVGGDLAVQQPRFASGLPSVSASTSCSSTTSTPRSRILAMKSA